MKILLMFFIMIFTLFCSEDYIIIKNKNVKVYDGITAGSQVIGNFSYGKRLDLIEYDNDFAKVFFRSTDGLDYVGYIKRKEVYVREVDEEKALNKIIKLNEFIEKKLLENKSLVITQSYAYDQDVTGGLNVTDSEGERSANAQKFYKSTGPKAKWVYLADRSLVAIESSDKEYVKISTPEREEFLYIKKKDFKYTKKTEIFGVIEKIAVVDRTNQNTQLYDYVGGEFLLTKSSQSTTGYNDNVNSYKTPKGYYIVSNVKPFMMYYDLPKNANETKKIGRALYAVRFSGGYYLHGIPLKDELKGVEREQTRKNVAAILGGHPSSHGCVRNDDEDAKFIYDWTNSVEVTKGYFIPQFPVAVIVTD